MQFRTIQKTADTGRLNRERVRAAVIRVRDRRWAAAARAMSLLPPGVMLAGQPRAPFDILLDDGDDDGG